MNGLKRVCGEGTHAISQRPHVESTVTHPQGMHARPAAAIARTVRQFSSEVRVHRRGRVADASSMLELMVLGVPHGTGLLLTAEGPDAEEALNALEELFANDFGLAEE